MGTAENGPDWWPGGFIRRGKKRDIYVIERRVAGVKFKVSTRASSLTAAMKQLERFEADPDNYRPADGRVGLALTAELILEYRQHQVGKGLSHGWTRDVARLLAHWADDLAGKDLRKLDLQKDIKPILQRRGGGVVSRGNALRGFMKWLRREKGLLKKHEDATVDLAPPKGRPRKVTDPRDMRLEDVRAVAPHLADHPRDILVLQMGTGWHLSEVRRFAERGQLHVPREGDVLAVLITEHKGGRLTQTPLRHPEHVEAAKRLKLRGGILTDWVLNYHARRASEAAGLKRRFYFGSMRHSVGTWAVEAGAREAEVSEFFGHRSRTTTRDTYVRAKVPTVSVPVHTLGDATLH